MENAAEKCEFIVLAFLNHDDNARTELSKVIFNIIERQNLM